MDGSIRCIATTYNSQGLVYTVTSYTTDYVDDAHIANQVENIYNGFGQLTIQYQENNGAVDTQTSAKVQYSYDTPAHGSRLLSMTYPSGETISYNYRTSGSLDDTISRLDSISDSTGTLESYQYLGVSTVVTRTQPQAGIAMTYVKLSGESNGDAGDQYTGLDRFGRVVDQRWIKTSSGTAVDRYQYTYDRDGNVVAKTNSLDSSYNETYTYDDLNQLSNMTRGGSAYQSFGLDALGNMNSVDTSGTTVDETHSDNNELTDMGNLTLTYDNDGNTTTDDQGHTLVYDAWNRLVKVKNGNTTMETFTYDGMGHRITETASNTTMHLYYSNQWQVLEEDRESGGDLLLHAQYVWSPTGVNTLVLRDQHLSSGNDGFWFSSTDRTYALQDANNNVTALVTYNSGTSSWSVTQRYVYDSYGKAIVLDGSWSSTSDSLAWKVMYQGERFDTISGTYVMDERVYSPTMMRFLQQDPMGYVDGPNTYQFVGDDPISMVDPTGLAAEPYDSEGKSPLRVISVDGGQNGKDKIYVNFNLEKYLGKVETGGAYPAANLAIILAGKVINHIPGASEMQKYADAIAACFSWGGDNVTWEYIMKVDFTVTLTYRTDKCPPQLESFVLKNINLDSLESPTWGDGSAASFKLKPDEEGFKSAIEAMTGVFEQAKDDAETASEALKDAKELDKEIAGIEERLEKEVGQTGGVAR